MPGWKAQYWPKFFTFKQKVFDGLGPVQSLTIQSHTRSLLKSYEDPQTRSWKSCIPQEFLSH